MPQPLHDAGVPVVPCAFGVRMMEARIEAGVSQKALSLLSGVHEKTVRNIESGATQFPSDLTKRKLERALDMAQGPRPVDVELDGPLASEGTVFTLSDDPVAALAQLAELMQRTAERLAELQKGPHQEHA